MDAACEVAQLGEASIELVLGADGLETKLARFTIAEALTNVAKYAQATEAVITIASGVEHAQVEIRDDGIGGADPTGGSGLRGLVDRLGALGGHLHVRSELGHGTTIHAVVPLDPHQAGSDVTCGCCAEGQCRCAA